MSEVAGRKVIRAGTVELTVKELCVSEIRALLSSAEAVNEDDALGDFLLPDLRLCDLMAFTTLTKDQVEQMLPSHLDEVLAECKAMNRHFFEMGARLAKRQAMP